MMTTTHVDEFKSAGQSPGPIPLAKGTKLSVCLMGGKHTPGSEWERECPLNPERIAKRSARAAAIWASRREKQGVLDAVEKPTGAGQADDLPGSSGRLIPGKSQCSGAS